MPADRQTERAVTDGTVRQTRVTCGHHVDQSRGLIFQPVHVSLPYAQTCTYNSDTTITLQTERERERGIWKRRRVRRVMRY